MAPNPSVSPSGYSTESAKPADKEEDRDFAGHALWPGDERSQPVGMAVLDPAINHVGVLEMLALRRGLRRCQDWGAEGEAAEEKEARAMSKHGVKDGRSGPK